MPYNLLQCRTQAEVLSFLGGLYHRGKSKPGRIILWFENKDFLEITYNAQGLQAWLVSGTTHAEVEIDPDIMSASIWNAIEIIRNEKTRH